MGVLWSKFGPKIWELISCGEFYHTPVVPGATRWQEHGIPLRTVQAWLGHKNLETTQRYLGVTDSGKLRGQIDAAFGD